MAGYDFNVALSGSSSATSGVSDDNRFTAGDFLVGDGASKNPSWLVPMVLGISALVVVIFLLRKN